MIGWKRMSKETDSNDAENIEIENGVIKTIKKIERIYLIHNSWYR